MLPHVAIQQLKRMISQIDAAAETPVVNEYRICTTTFTSAATAKLACIVLPQGETACRWHASRLRN
jgi:hypothetical protein